MIRFGKRGGERKGAKFARPDKHCSICSGLGYLENWRAADYCPFCNGTGEPTKAAESFMKSHPCQCFQTDRQNCSLCKQRCHHTSSSKPKLV